MRVESFLDRFCSSAPNRTWAILQALTAGVGYNELAFYALTLQYHVHPNKKRWNIIYKIFLMPRDSSVESKVRSGEIHTLSGLQLKYFIDPVNALSPARQSLKTKYSEEIFPELLKTFEKGDPAQGRKKVNALTKFGQKLTAYKRKVGEGDFNAVVTQVSRAGGPIDLFAQTINVFPEIHDLFAGSSAARLRVGIYNANHGATSSETKEHWLTNLQNTLPKYDLDATDAGLGCEISDYI